MKLVRPTLADDGGYRPGLHPEHPAAVEGCRPVSRGLMLELVTGANVIRGCGSCRLANHLQEKSEGLKRPHWPNVAGGGVLSGETLAGIKAPAPRGECDFLRGGPVVESLESSNIRSLQI